MTDTDLMSARPRNALDQYDDLADAWWKPDGAFAALHWLADARGGLLPAPPGPDAVLVDVGCGGGLLSPHARGYVHLGLDMTESALRTAGQHGVVAIRGDATRLPLADACADVVVAGEILEHVRPLDAVVAELARILRPGGTIVLDTINATRAARFALVTVAERLPGGPPPRIHDPALFVSAERLVEYFDRQGVRLRLSGLRPSASDYVRFLVDRKRSVRMLPTPSLALVYQGVGIKEHP